jgi:hypothetical protein
MTVTTTRYRSGTHVQWSQAGTIACVTTACTEQGSGNPGEMPVAREARARLELVMRAVAGIAT